MKVGLICGSHRQNSQSFKVGSYMVNRLKDLGISNSQYILDLGGNSLPMWEEFPDKSKNKDFWQDQWPEIKKQLASCDAFILVVPEWAGMATPGIKNFLLLCSPSELGHKPALITSVSAGMGGAYPISDLRASGYKNNYIHYLPEHLIVRNVAGNLNSGDASGDDEIRLRARVDYNLRLLCRYGEQIKPIRQEGILDYKTYPFGM